MGRTSRKTFTGWKMVLFGKSESEKKSWQDHLSEHHESQDRGPYKLPPGDLYIMLKGICCMRGHWCTLFPNMRHNTVSCKGTQTSSDPKPNQAWAHKTVVTGSSQGSLSSTFSYISCFTSRNQDSLAKSQFRQLCRPLLHAAPLPSKTTEDLVRQLDALLSRRGATVFTSVELNI